MQPTGDIKLENLMMVSHDDDSEVKIIDLGLCVPYPESGIYVGKKVRGTVGCYAPESIRKLEYSTKSDMWQLGCVLYAMLSGMLPFNPDYPAQITKSKYYDMVGMGWDHISDEGKDLVAKLLRKNPIRRYGINEVLNHPWMIHRAPEVSMDSAYVKRIKGLGLRQQLRSFFLRNDIIASHKERRERVKRIFPFLSGSLETLQSPKQSAAEVSYNEANSAKFQNKLQTMKRIIVKSYSSSSASDEHDSVGKSVVAGKISYPAFVSLLLNCQLPELAQPEVFNIFDITGGGSIDLREFLLALLAFQPTVIESDDITELIRKSSSSAPNSNTNTASSNCGIDEDDKAPDPIKQDAVCPEMLTPSCVKSDSLLEVEERNAFGGDDYPYANEEEAAARLYFQVFDMDNSGSISLEELQLVVGCLLQEGSMTGGGHVPGHLPGHLHGHQSYSEHLTNYIMASDAASHADQLPPSIEELFEAIDVSGDGEISFEEFLAFYHAVMRYSNTKTASLRLDSSQRSSLLSASVNAGLGSADEDDWASDEEADTHVRMLNGAMSSIL
jgi:serine/threonine protein kinase